MTTRTESATVEQTGWYRNFTQSAATKYWAAISRLLIGFVFLWAFLDKCFGLGYTTQSEAAWQFGAGDGSPTFGFLTFGTNPDGPFASFFSDTLGGSAGTMGAEGPVLNPNSWVNWGFMLALLTIGVTLMLGVFMRLAAIGGAVLLFLMYLAEWPLNAVDPETGLNTANNPIIDDHIVYGAVLIMLMLFEAGRVWGLGKVWESTSLVKSQPWLA